MSDHPELERIPSVEELATIANALRGFLDAVRQDEDILSDSESSGIARLLPTYDVVHRLWLLERLFNPSREPFGSLRLGRLLIAEWPDPVATRIADIKDRVYKIIEKWGIPEICEDKTWHHIHRAGDQPAQICVLTDDEFCRLSRALAWFDSACSAVRPDSEADGDSGRETKNEPTPTAWKFLRNLRRAKAFDKKRKSKIPSIAEDRQHFIGNVGSAHVTDAVAQLKVLGLIETGRGATGGVWLTESGKTIALPETH